MNPRAFALDMVSRNPSIANNPNAQRMLAAIQNNDAVAGEKIANNLCDTYGITKEEALERAASFFHIM